MIHILIFLIQISACLVATVGAVFLFIYLFVDHNNKQYKRNGIILSLIGFAVAVLAFIIDFLLI